jgi:hypothetical protein
LSFSRTQNNITETISPSETEERVTVQTTRNLDHVDVYSLAFVVPVKVTKWWDTTNNLNFTWARTQGQCLTPRCRTRGILRGMSTRRTISSSATDSLPNCRELPGARKLRFRPHPTHLVYQLRLAEKFENKSTLKLAVNDIFNSNEIQATTRFTSYTEHFLVKRDTQTIVLSYTYNFGNSNGAIRRRTGGADDIKQRAGSNNG